MKSVPRRPVCPFCLSGICPFRQALPNGCTVSVLSLDLTTPQAIRLVPIEGGLALKKLMKGGKFFD